MSSIRNGTMRTFFATARSTSRRICGDSLACPEKIRTITSALEIASTIAPPQSVPAMMSRGAIQQRSPLASSPRHTLSATSLSLLE